MAPELLTTDERKLLNTLRSMGSRVTLEGQPNTVYCTSHGVQPYTTINAFGAVRMLCVQCVEMYWNDPPPAPEEATYKKILQTCLECGSDDNGILNMHVCIWCQRDVCGACIDWSNTKQDLDEETLVCTSCAKDLDTEIADLMDRQCGE